MKQNYWRRLCALCGVIVLCIGMLQAQPRKKVGLVLGGGGAKGAAEVGVLKVIEEAGIPIDYIAGTSIGAIVGGLYAVGYDAADLDTLFRSQEWISLLSDQVKRESETFLTKDETEKYLVHVPLTKEQKLKLPMGYVAGQNIVNLFSKLTMGYHDVDNFANLPIPFNCVAVDVVSGKEVVLSSGSLPLAMRASMSIPGVFAPVEKDSMLLIDGGALNNLPVDVVRRMGADVVICVDLGKGWKTKKQLTSVTSMVGQLINIMGQQKYFANKKDADLYLNPPLEGFTAGSFTHTAIDTMLVRGEQTARAHWDELVAFRNMVLGDSVPAVPLHRTKPYLGAYEVGEVRVEGIRGAEKDWIMKKIGVKPHSMVRPEQIDSALSMLQGLDIFSRVEYRLTDSEPRDVVFMLEPKEYRHINVGARFDTQELASILVNFSNNQQLSTRHHYALTGRIAHNPYMEVNYSFGHLFGAKGGVSYQVNLHDFDLYDKHHKVGNEEFVSHAVSGHFLLDTKNSRWQLGARFEYFNYHGDIYAYDRTPYFRHTDRFLTYYSDFVMDTYDQRYFPTTGIRMRFQGAVHTDNGWTYGGTTPFGEVSFRTSTAHSLGKRFCFLPSAWGRVLIGNNVPAIYQNYVGGLVEGYYIPWQQTWESATRMHLAYNSMVAARMALRYSIKRMLYATAFCEYGRTAPNAQDLLSHRGLWGCGLRLSYDLIIGPISAQVNYSNLDSKPGVYINAGFLF